MRQIGKALLSFEQKKSGTGKRLSLNLPVLVSKKATLARNLSHNPLNVFFLRNTCSVNDRGS